MKLPILLSFLLLTTPISGCTVLKKQEEGPITSNTKPSNKQRSNFAAANVETQLLAAAQSIEQSLSTLAAAENAESAPILNTAPLVTPEGGMSGLADVDWTGPIGPLVDKIANMTDYRVKVLGNEPAIPILVSISSKRTVIADILQNASLQAGRRAQILVFPSSRLIEVRYAS